MASTSSTLWTPPETPEGLRELPIIATLRRTWQRHYERTTARGQRQAQPAVARVRFKANRELPPAAEGIESPYDPEARYRHKCDTQWTGYMVHVSETCEPTAPHLLTHVHTTTAARSMRPSAPPPFTQALSAKDLAPRGAFRRCAPISAPTLLVAQPRRSRHHLARPHAADPRVASPCRRGLHSLPVHGGLGAAAGRAVPRASVSTVWREYGDREGKPYIIVRFSLQDCGPCHARPLCYPGQQTGRRLRLPSQERLRRSRRPGPGLPVRRGSSAINVAPGSKGHSRRGCGPLACAGPGIGA